MSRKIFIDCGFYGGGSISTFKSTPEYSGDFIYYAFDPAMNVEKSKSQFPHVNLFKKAIWISDGTISFYTSSRKGGRANGLYHNPKASCENTCQSECLDFSSWIKNNFTKDDYIIVKMDVEGAEYEVIPKMIKDMSIDLVNIIYLEWHNSRAGDADCSKLNKIMADLKDKKDLIVRKSLERYLRWLKRTKSKGK